MLPRGSNPTVFLVHIPKTAGTSLRKAAQRHLPGGKVEYDYGRESAETTPRVARHVYDESDLYALANALEKARSRLLVGHVPLGKYLPLVGSANCISMVREPAARLVSEYNHRVRFERLDISFGEFYRTASQINRQARLLGAAPLEAMGFIGLTEQYAESVRLLNGAYRWKLRCLNLNKAAPNGLRVEELDRSVIAEIRELHYRDVRLHERVQGLLRERLILADAGKPYVHGLIDTSGRDGVRGWAWHEPRNQKQPVELELVRNGQVVDSTRATQLRDDLGAWAPPRLGYVGFEFDVPDPGAGLEVRVRQTGQVLGRGARDGADSSPVVAGAIESPDPDHGAGEISGWVDRVDRFGVLGWAACRASPERPIDVSMLLDGELVGRVRCDRFRPDVLGAGKHPTGVCGFNFEWPRKRVTIRSREVEIRLECDREYRFSARVEF